MPKASRTTRKNIICGCTALSMCFPIPAYAGVADTSSVENIEFTSEASQTYTMTYLNTLSNDDLINLLTTPQCVIADLFTSNSAVFQFYSDSKRIQALIDAIEVRGSEFTDTDDKGLPTLVEVLISGYYLAYSHKELKALTDQNERDKCLPAMKAIQKSPYFKLGNKPAEDLIESLGRWIGNTSSDVEVVHGFVPILEQYQDQIATSPSNRSTNRSVFEVIKGVALSIQRYKYEQKSKSAATPWDKKIDPYIKEIGKIALNGHVHQTDHAMMHNALYYTGMMGELLSNPSDGNQVLTQALSLYPDLSEPYMIAAQNIHRHYAGIDATGKSIDLDTIVQKAKNHYLPHTYSFDDGKIIFKTGDRVDIDQIKRLYWASKEVKSQFHRILGNDQALEPGNADDVLTVVIYNSPKEYGMNNILYGYSVDNGGIYIEPVGTFFTYEKTSDESIYSLEELFRHEFTHYLQGRFQKPGLWGHAPLYEHERLTWFDEGEADFMAGSTRTKGVQPRKSIVGNLSTAPSERFSLSQNVHATYNSGWTFYNYSSALIDYFYRNDMEIYTEINQFLKANDGEGFDTYMKQLSQNKQVNEDYQQHMQNLKHQYDHLDVPQATDDYLVQHSPRNLADIGADIQAVASLQNVTTTTSKSEFFHTFHLQGTYVGTTSAGQAKDWEKMNLLADQFLHTLQTYPWTGYTTVTCYFTNYRVNAAHQFEYDVTFHGLLTSENEQMDEPMKEQVDEQVDERFKQATGPLPFDKTIYGELKNDDYVAMYYFDVTVPEKLNIQLTDHAGMNWLLFHESDLSDLNHYVAYATDEAEHLSGSYQAKPGRYYLCVYKFIHTDKSYTLYLNKEDIYPAEAPPAEK